MKHLYHIRGFFASFILAVFLISCGAPGAGGALGSSFELPPGQIRSWPGGSEQAWVHYSDEEGSTIGSAGPVTVGSDGYFPGMTVPEPAANILVGWSDVAYALASGSDVVPQVTDPDARSQAIVDVYIGSNPDDSIVLGDTDTAFWWYVDRDIDVTGSGSFTESADTGTLTFAVNLKAGWNSVVWRYVSGGVVVEDGPVPTGYAWTYH